MSMPFETGDPSSKPDLLAALERLNEASQRYVAGLPARVFVQPQGEKWSPADHVRHLSKSTFAVARGLGLPKLVLLALFGPGSGASLSLPGLREIYLARLRAGGKAGRFAPSPRPIPVDTEAYRDQVLASWRTAASELRAKADGWAEAALDRYRLPHPLLGRLTVREMLFFTLYHNAHHLNLVASRVQPDETAEDDT